MSLSSSRLALTPRPGTDSAPRANSRASLALLVGSGDKIGLVALPFLALGIGLNLWRPSLFDVGGPPAALKALSVAVLVVGVVNWIWSVVLILTKVPEGKLITSGPYAVVKHPLYTGVALLVAPWLGFLLNSWLGVVVGVALYVGSRVFSPDEERFLASTFGEAWDAYCKNVKLPWL